MASSSPSCNVGARARRRREMFDREEIYGTLLVTDTHPWGGGAMSSCQLYGRWIFFSGVCQIVSFRVIGCNHFLFHTHTVFALLLLTPLSALSPSPFPTHSSRLSCFHFPSCVSLRAMSGECVCLYVY